MDDLTSELCYAVCYCKPYNSCEIRLIQNLVDQGADIHWDGLTSFVKDIRVLKIFVGAGLDPHSPKLFDYSLLDNDLERVEYLIGLGVKVGRVLPEYRGYVKPDILAVLEQARAKELRRVKPARR